MKIGIICQRYGTGIAGGAEIHCRYVAERLAQKHEVDVLTSCARDYITWKNELPQGRSAVNGVYVYRFPTIKERNMPQFNRVSETIFGRQHTSEDELRWLEDQGPLCPGLIDYLKAMHRSYDRLIFFTYLYYPTYYGLQVAPHKSLLVPTAHDEPAIRLGIYKEVFSKPYAFIFNTAEEKDFVQSLFGTDTPYVLAGVGVDVPQHINKKKFKRKQGFIEDYFYYAGRIDEGKGCKELIDFYLKKRRANSDFPFLVLSGHLEMDLPRDPSVIFLGYLSEQEKQEAFQGALCVIIPSVMESLSIVLLESFASRTPVLVRENCRVLKEHCIKSNGGLFYGDYEEFSASIDYLMEHPHTRHQMGINGQKYVQNNYSWDRIMSTYEQVFSLNTIPAYDKDKVT